MRFNNNNYLKAFPRDETKVSKTEESVIDNPDKKDPDNPDLEDNDEQGGVTDGT